MKILGYILALVSLTLFPVFGGEYKLFLDIPSVMILFLPYIGLTCAKFGKNYLAFWKLESSQRNEFIQWSNKVITELGWFGVLSGFVICFGTYDDNFMKLPDDISSLFKAISVCLLPLVYTSLFKILVLYPFRKIESWSRARVI